MYDGDAYVNVVDNNLVIFGMNSESIMDSEVVEAVDAVKLESDNVDENNDDDGEVESESNNSENGNNVEDPASPDTEQVKETGFMLRSSTQDATGTEAADEPTQGEEDGYYEDDGRSETPLQDEPDEANGDGGEEGETEGGGGDVGETTNSPRRNSLGYIGDDISSTEMDGDDDNDDLGAAVPTEVVDRFDVARKQSVRDDVGELDYEEDEPVQETGAENRTESGDEDEKKKLKELKKRVKEPKEEKVS